MNYSSKTPTLFSYEYIGGIRYGQSCLNHKKVSSGCRSFTEIKTQNMIAIVIHIAYPDYKRPSVCTDYQMADDPQKAIEFVRDIFRQFLVDRHYDVHDSETWWKFCDRTYSDSFVGNAPFEYRLFVGNSWVQPTSMETMYLEVRDGIMQGCRQDKACGYGESEDN